MQLLKFLPLNDKSLKLKYIGPGEIANKKVLSINVECDGCPHMHLYFDAADALLVACRFRCKPCASKPKEIDFEYTFSDYKGVNGIKVAHRIMVRRDGERFYESEVSGMTTKEKLDPKLFARP